SLRSLGGSAPAVRRLRGEGDVREEHDWCAAHDGAHPPRWHAGPALSAGSRRRPRRRGAGCDPRRKKGARSSGQLMAPLAAVALFGLGSENPGPRRKARLDAWCADHGVRFEEPAPEPSSASSDGELRELGDDCERALEQARDQFTAGDERSARQTLARLEQALREQPRLPQAAWLLAERYRLEA